MGLFVRWPIRFPGRLVRQFGQWYATGTDCYGERVVGMGETRAAARENRDELLLAMRQYQEADDAESRPLGRSVARPKHWCPPLCRLGLHRWRIQWGGRNQFQFSEHRCERCGKRRRS